MTSLLDAVRRHTETHASPEGVAATPIPGLRTVRATTPSGLLHAISRPLVCLVVQGSKQVTTGAQAFNFSAGESLLVTANVPTVSQITRASAAEPYLSLVLELDPAVIAALALDIATAEDSAGPPLRVDSTDQETADVALRLMRLLNRPAAIPVLYRPLVRELHYWLLAGKHGAAIRRLGWPDGHAGRIGRAIAILRRDYAQPLPVETLAAAAGMSASSFHHHFREATSLSPLQFQKQLRLIEARRLMVSEDMNASRAAFSVGYESVNQFTREYRRLFGLPPVQDSRTARGRAREPEPLRPPTASGP